MSVLIKNMEMPKSCNECFLAVPVLNYGRSEYISICPFDKNSIDCPLVEVPTPHGRLIDADELEVDTEWSDYYDGYQSYSAMQIKYAPTVIESEDDNILLSP